MQWLKFSCIVFLFLLSTGAWAEKFSSQNCLHAKYETSITHKGKFFGLIENKLSVKKDKCFIEVTFKGILETIWKIDVCREPIHMKVTSKGSQDVYKRDKKCDDQTKSDYCYYTKELMNSVQDHGLIFADGQREDLTESHGQTYCAYLLLQRYLDDGIIFSTFENPKNIYKEQTACEIPGAAKVTSPVKEVEENKPSEKLEQKIGPASDTPRGMRPLTKEESTELNSDDKPRF